MNLQLKGKEIKIIQKEELISFRKIIFTKKYTNSMKSKKRFSFNDRFKSFGYAIHGLKITYQEEHNFRIHLIAAVLVVGLSFLLQISTYEWLALLFSIGFVLVCELLNTAIENFADFVSPEDSLSIKRIKDIAAAAVLVSSITALLIGTVIFIPKILAYI